MSNAPSSAAPTSGNDIWSRVLLSRRRSCEALGDAVLQELLQQGGWNSHHDEAPPDLEPLASLEWLLQYYFALVIDEHCSPQKRRHNYKLLKEFLAKIDHAVAAHNDGDEAISFDEVPNRASEELRPSASRWGPPLANRSPSVASRQATNANDPSPMSIESFPEVPDPGNGRGAVTNFSLTSQNLASHNAAQNSKDAPSSKLSALDKNTQEQRYSAATTTTTAKTTSNQPPAEPSHGPTSHSTNQKRHAIMGTAESQALATSTNSSNRQSTAAVTYLLGQSRRENSSSFVVNKTTPTRPAPGGSATLQVKPSPIVSERRQNQSNAALATNNDKTTGPTNGTTASRNPTQIASAATSTSHSITTPSSNTWQETPLKPIANSITTAQSGNATAVRNAVQNASATANTAHSATPSSPSSQLPPAKPSAHARTTGQANSTTAFQNPALNVSSTAEPGHSTAPSPHSSQVPPIKPSASMAETIIPHPVSTTPDDSYVAQASSTPTSDVALQFIPPVHTWRPKPVAPLTNGTIPSHTETNMARDSDLSASRTLPSVSAPPLKPAASTASNTRPESQQANALSQNSVTNGGARPESQQANALSQNRVTNGGATDSVVKESHSSQAQYSNPNKADTTRTTNQRDYLSSASTNSGGVSQSVPSQSTQVPSLTSTAAESTLPTTSKPTSTTVGSASNLTPRIQSPSDTGLSQPTTNSRTPSSNHTSTTIGSASNLTKPIQSPSNTGLSQPTNNNRNPVSINNSTIVGSASNVTPPIHFPSNTGLSQAMDNTSSIPTGSSAPGSLQHVSSQPPPTKPAAPLVNGRNSSHTEYQRHNPNPYLSHAASRSLQQQNQLDRTPNETRNDVRVAPSSDLQRKNAPAAGQGLPAMQPSGHPSTSNESKITENAGSIPLANSSPKVPFQQVRNPEGGNKAHRLAQVERSQVSHSGVCAPASLQKGISSTASSLGQNTAFSNSSHAERNTRDTDAVRTSSYYGPAGSYHGPTAEPHGSPRNGHKESQAHRKESGFSGARNSQQMRSNPNPSRGASTSQPGKSSQSHQSHDQTNFSARSREAHAHLSRSRSPTPISAPSTDILARAREVTVDRSRSRSPTPTSATVAERRPSASHEPERWVYQGSQLHTAVSTATNNHFSSQQPFRPSSNSSIQPFSKTVEPVDSRGSLNSITTGHAETDVSREIAKINVMIKNGQSKQAQQTSHQGNYYSPRPLGTKTITFPAEFDRQKALSFYGGIHPRHQTRVTFSPFRPSQRQRDYCLNRLAEWEPFWKVNIVSELGQTWKVDKLERSEMDISAAPTTAAELKWTLLKTDAERVRDWGNDQARQNYNQGDCRLLLFMLPAKVDMKKRADTHLWPKETFLTLDGVPVKLSQRKQQAHDPTLWYGMCDVLDISQLIKQPLSSHTIQICCIEQDQFFCCLGICQRVTPANLFNAEPLISLSQKEATKRALEFAKPMLCMDGDDDGGINEGAGRLVFSLVCPISKAIMKKPVRGEVCAHFQCFDLLTFLESNVRTSGGRWRCASCENFISWRSLRFCGLTAALLQEFEGQSSVVRDRVEFNADGSYRLLDETKARYNKKRKASNDNAGSSSNKRPAVSAQDAIEIQDDDDD